MRNSHNPFARSGFSPPSLPLPHRAFCGHINRHRIEQFVGHINRHGIEKFSIMRGNAWQQRQMKTERERKINVDCLNTSSQMRVLVDDEYTECNVRSGVCNVTSGVCNVKSGVNIM